METEKAHVAGRAILLRGLISGLLTGVLYSLVAIGFVLIYKASGVFNFAQGAMVLFAAMTLVGISDLGVNIAVSALLTIL